LIQLPLIAHGASYDRSPPLTVTMEGLPTRSATEVLSEVIEAAIHIILCARGVYPLAIFERRRLHGIPVYMSRHPDLNTYIATVLLNAKPLLRAGAVDGIACVILGGGGEPLEYYIFQVNHLGLSGEATGGQEEDILFDIENQMRDLLLRTMALQWHAAALPEGRRFALRVHARDDATTCLNLDPCSALSSGRWLLATKDETAAVSQPGRITPLSAVASTCLNFQLLRICPLEKHMGSQESEESTRG
jgi:mitotic spindle assembly checkpoint protein MAD2B